MLKYQQVLDKIITEDVERGFALQLHIALLHRLKNASLAPLGCQLQESINDLGARIPKYRMTHDQIFKGPSGGLVQSWSHPVCTALHFWEFYITLLA
jgi:hypothetical protein